jgi:hypothetical protein
MFFFILAVGFQVQIYKRELSLIKGNSDKYVNSVKFLLTCLPAGRFVYEIRKVKAVSPSPFYDGKYHPPGISSVTCL